MTEAQILADFPDLQPDHIRATLAFPAARERRLADPRPPKGAPAAPALRREPESAPVAAVRRCFPDSQHVHDLALRGATDLDIWLRAATDGFLLVSKDDDFRQVSVLRGAPPKVIWLLVGNVATEPIAPLLERRLALIDAFVSGPDEALLVLRLPDALGGEPGIAQGQELSSTLSGLSCRR